MHTAVTDRVPESPGLPDRRFAVVTGLWVAALVAPAVLGAVVWWGRPTAVGFYAALLATVVAVTTGVAWLVGRWRGLDLRLGSIPTALAVTVTGMLGLVSFAGYIALIFVVAIADAPSHVDGTGLLFGVGGSGAVVLGVAVMVMARTRVVHAAVGDAVDAEWTTGWGSDRPRWMQVTGGTLLVAWVVAVLWLWSQGGRWFTLVVSLSGLVFMASLGLSGFSVPWTFRATSVGLEVQGPLNRRVTAWDEFDGVAVTDDAVVLRRTFPRFDRRFDRDDLNDELHVVEAIERYVDRRDD